MKILYISLHLLTRKVSSGGDHIFLETAIRWSKKGHDLTLLVPEISAGEFKEKIPNAKLITINPSWLEKGESYNRWFSLVFPIYLIRMFQALKTLNTLEQFDVVATNGDFFCNVIPASKLKNSKWLSFIYHINESPFKRKGNSFFMSCVSFLMQRFSFRVIKKKADTVILLNNQVKDDLIAQGFKEEKLKVAGCGINYKQIQQYPPQAEMSYDVCALGRIYPTKGVFDLPVIWEKVIESNPSAKLVIIGTGPESWTEELKKLIQRKGLTDNIHLLGFISTGKVYGILKSAKVFVTASYEEGWGISVCEAMACGLPVVAYDLSAFREVFGDSVDLVPRGNTSAMAEKILYYLENDNIRKQKTHIVRNVASQFDWDTISEDYLNSIRTGN